MNIVVGQSGGPTAVINASLYGVIQESVSNLPIFGHFCHPIFGHMPARRSAPSRSWRRIGRGNDLPDSE